MARAHESFESHIPQLYKQGTSLRAEKGIGSCAFCSFARLLCNRPFNQESATSSVVGHVFFLLIPQRWSDVSINGRVVALPDKWLFRLSILLRPQPDRNLRKR